MKNTKLNTSNINEKSTNTLLKRSKKDNQFGGSLFSWLADGTTDNLVLDALSAGKLDTALWLLGKGVSVDLNATDANEKTVLHYLVLNANNNEAKTALMKVLDSDVSESINKQDNEGNTAVHYAALNGHDDIVEKLREKGADLNIKNKQEMYVGTDTESANEVKKNTNTESVFQKIDNDKNSLAKGLGNENDAQMMTPLSLSITQTQKDEKDNYSATSVNGSPHVRQFESEIVNKNNALSATSDNNIKASYNVNSATSPVGNNASDTDNFMQSVLEKINGGMNNAQFGGKHKKTTKNVVSGVRKIVTYSELSTGGGHEDYSPDSDSSLSEMARQIQNQADDVHQRVIKKIMEIMNCDETVAINYKSALYQKVKNDHPELNYYDRAVEMEKITTEKELKKIDIDKVTKERTKHLAELDNKKRHRSDEKKSSDEKSVKKDKKEKREKKTRTVSDSSISINTDDL